MQTVYAYHQGASDSVSFLTAQLERNIELFLQLYLVDLIYLRESATYVDIYADKISTKHIISEEEKNVNLSIKHNRIVQHIAEDDRLKQYFKKYKAEAFIDQDVRKKFFKTWIKRDDYQAYIKLENPTLEDDKAIIISFLRKIMHDNDDYMHFLEEHFINLPDDNHQVNFLVQKAIESFDPDKKISLFELNAETDEGIEFSKELLSCYISRAEEFEEKIQPKLKNWDIDRVAVLDIVLIKMALCEFKYFKSIPVKVTINEYVDIAKYYSTPKSKDFVNGIIDKLMREMKANNEIQKEGRGLIDF